jgi:hypothetical protein
MWIRVKPKPLFDGDIEQRLPGVEAEAARECQRARKLCLARTTRENRGEQTAQSILSRFLIDLATRFGELLGPLLTTIWSLAASPAWVDNDLQRWLTYIEVIVMQGVRELSKRAIALDDIEILRGVTATLSRDIILPAKACLQQLRKRTLGWYGGLIGAESLVQGFSLRSLGIDGGLSHTGPIALLTAITLVALGTGLGTAFGYLAARLDRRELSRRRRRAFDVLGVVVVVIFASGAGVVALYVIAAMGVVRISGTFQIDALVKIVMSPTPTHIGGLVLSISNVVILLIAVKLSYRLRRQVNEKLAALLAVEALLTDEQEKDLATRQAILVAIPAAAEAAFLAGCGQRRQTRAAARNCLIAVETTFAQFKDAATCAARTAEDWINTKREVVGETMRGKVEVPAYFDEAVDLASVLAPVLADADRDVAKVRDYVEQSETADDKTTVKIDAAIKEIHTAVRDGLRKLDAATRVYPIMPTPSTVAAKASPSRLAQFKPREDGDAAAAAE